MRADHAYEATLELREFAAERGVLMVRWQSGLDDVRRAIAELHDACAIDGDSHRASTAEWLDELFADVADAETLRRRAREARRLYAGGMGSFSDVGTAPMDAAVESLRSALRAAARPWFLSFVASTRAS